MADEEPGDHDETERAQQPSDSATERGNERKAARVRREEREADQFWRKVFDNEIGRREMWRIIAGPSSGHAFETRFMSSPAGFPDKDATWHARGEQDLALRLYHSWLLRFPEQVAAMHRENDPRFAQPKKRKTGE